MIRSLAISVILALTGAAAIASALEAPQYCCACTEGFTDTSSPVNGTASTAAFCIATNSGEQADEAAARCKALTGHALVCVLCVAGSSCHQDLAGAGILCPTSPAPAAGGTSLLALAVVLAAGGSFLLRRRRA